MAALLLAANAGAADASRGARLQVAIVRQAAAVRISPEGTVIVRSPGGHDRILEWKGELTLKPREGGLRLAETRLQTETRLIPQKGARVRVGPDLHSGTLILRLDPGQTVTIVEELEVEDYLQGVLPHEMDPGWPLEALKAQAVVARTFTYANMGKFSKDGFDLTADTRSQVFKGLSGVNENVRSAVRQTRGEVLGYDGKLLRVYYHACCGGATTDPGAAWNSEGRSPQPLRGVRDPWCRLSPHMKWSAYFTWADLTAAVSQRSMLADSMTSLKIGARDAAGFVRTFVIRAGRRSSEIRGAELRGALGAGEMKSVHIKSLSARNKGVEFFGSGMGHGVGLCQWGARLQADKGRSYGKILRFYFPGSVLSEIDE